MTEIVRIREEHLDEIAEIEKAVFREPWSASALKFLLGDGAVGFAVTEDGKVCAYGSMAIVLDEGQILNIATRPDKKRQGHATRVLIKLIEHARENSLSLMTLEVRESNFAARELYQKHGFAEIGRRKNFYKLPTEDAILMGIDL